MWLAWKVIFLEPTKALVGFSGSGLFRLRLPLFTEVNDLILVSVCYGFWLSSLCWKHKPEYWFFGLSAIIAFYSIG